MKNLQLLFALSVLTFISCKKESTYEKAEFIYSEDQCDSITYTKHIQPIIEKNCLSCHGGDVSPNLSSYSNVKAKAERIYIRAIETGTMPPNENNVLSKEDQVTFSCWYNSDKKE